jgi:hypothetical protein
MAEERLLDVVACRIEHLRGYIDAAASASVLRCETNWPPALPLRRKEEPSTRNYQPEMGVSSSS